MAKSTLASMLSREERAVMNATARGNRSRIGKEELINSQKQKHSIENGLTGKDVDKFLLVNSTKRPIKVKEKNQKAEQVDKTEEV
jgi:hypothetical protein